MSPTSRTLVGVAPPAPRPSAHDRTLPVLLGQRAVFVVAYAEALEACGRSYLAKELALAEVANGRQVDFRSLAMYDVLCERAARRGTR